MSKAFVLMTAMPPTTGHLQLIQFANLLAEDGVNVIVSTQPCEPLANERVQALEQAIERCKMTNVKIKHIHKTLEQDPKAPGFWDMWLYLMIGLGITSDDIIVASELYGQHLAEVTGAKFYPYDLNRSINSVKATKIRNNPSGNFKQIIPEFQPYLRTTVTVFGAESTGKSTLSRQLAKKLDGYWLFEYARPYLENTVNQITTDSMKAIWKGQTALQKQANNLLDKAYVVQDTDLFSTVGYWQFPHWQSQIGACPNDLVNQAIILKSDLYIVTKSNIPFEQDPLRYGGDVREGSDEYWVEICKKYKLNYVVLESSDKEDRLKEAVSAVEQVANEKFKLLSFDRHGL